MGVTITTATTDTAAIKPAFAPKTFEYVRYSFQQAYQQQLKDITNAIVSDTPYTYTAEDGTSQTFSNNDLASFQGYTFHIKSISAKETAISSLCTKALDTQKNILTNLASTLK